MLTGLMKMAYRNLASTTLRTILTMLGILVGTGSVVAMVSTGKMATEQALAQFKSLGTELLSVSLSDKDNASQSTAAKFTLQEALDIKKVSPDIEQVAPYVSMYLPVSYESRNVSASIIGGTEGLANVIRIKMLRGRFLSSFDSYEKYCIVGFNIYKTLKTYNVDPLNTRISLGTYRFTIIGVAAEWPENSFFNQDINNSIIVPIRTASFLTQSAEIRDLVILLRPDSNVVNIKTQLTEYLSTVAPSKELFFRSAEELAKSMEAQNRIFTLLLGLIGSISLLVGGIGVMNIMLVSVIERRREIGIRLALGAKRKEIQWMFLAEAVLLSVMSGILGVVIGVLISFIIAKVLGWSFTLFFLPPAIGFVVSVLIGVFFGYYPAHKAAQLDPIQTLRS